MIKYLLKTFLFCFVLTCARIDNCVSQNNSVIHVDSLPPDGIVLNSGWRFFVGDSPEYANPGFDDSAWEPINPTLDIHTSLPQIPEGRISWLRIRLSIDSSIHQLVMSIGQSVASEIYVNGILVHRFGVVDSVADNIKAMNPYERSYSFYFDDRAFQTIAIRFAKQPGISYATHWNSKNPGVAIRLSSVENANAYYHQTHTSIAFYDYFRTGVFGILAVVYLAFYFFYSAQRANLFFSIYAFLQALTWCSFVFYHQYDTIEHYSFIVNYILVIQLISHVFMLLAIYELRKLRKDWIFYALIVLAIACVPIGFVIYDWGWKFYGRYFTIIYFAAITWVVFRSFRNNKVAATIVAVGGVSFLLIWLAFINSLFSPYNLELFTVAHLSVPLAVSIYLGYDFALTNRSLQQKLLEVRTLSEEKQQILTDQNVVLEQQVTERTSALKKSLDDLKETQSQLVHSEKMASLGALVAGIAHEIKNPLNFVNNFAEVNKELLSELNDAIAKGNISDVKSIAKNISDNQEKIEHHGKRADGIVKSMLQHSRSTAGPKEPTDINALCDEYLRLTYHGYRAKDKSFTAKVETHYDLSIEKVTIVAQDMGRVVLNVINNAFYAVSEKKHQKGNDFIPEVIVSTRKREGRIEIIVKDNGTGIPANVLDKIFQPFFTTKPPGQGTGLGLSLSYDIVKVHGGEILVQSVEGNGAEFIIRL